MNDQSTKRKRISPLAKILILAILLGTILIVLFSCQPPVVIYDYFYFPKYRIAWNPGNAILAASRSSVDLYTSKLHKTLSLPGKTDTGEILSLAWSPDGVKLATSSENSILQIWDTTTQQSTRKNIQYAAYVIVWSPDSAYLAGGKTTDVVEIWDAQTLKVKATLKGHSDDVRTVDWSSDGKYIASGSDDKTVRLWDAQTYRSLAKFDTQDLVWNIAFSPDSTMLAAGTSDGRVLFWNVADKTLKNSLISGTGVMGTDAIAWRPDGKRFLTVNDETITLWDPSTYAKLIWWNLGSAKIEQASWSFDGSTIASIDIGGAIKVWNASTGEFITQEQKD